MIRMAMIHDKWPFELVEKKKITATAAVATLKPPNTPSHMRPPETTEEAENPDWPPDNFSEKMQDLVKEFEDVLVENLDKAESIECLPLEVKLKPNVKASFARKA